MSLDFSSETPTAFRKLPASVALLLAATSAITVAATALVLGQGTNAAPAEKKMQRAKPDEPQGRSLPELKPAGSIAAQYCQSVRDAVAEARYAHQSAQLDALAKQLDERLSRLDSKAAQLREWLARRDDIIAKATQQLVAIFAAMRPEAASEQLGRLDASTAAAVLTRLDSRVAGAILNDMPPDKAARITAIVAESANAIARAAKP